MRWDHWVDKGGLRGGTIEWIREDCEVGTARWDHWVRGSGCVR